MTDATVAAPAAAEQVNVTNTEAAAATSPAAPESTSEGKPARARYEPTGPVIHIAGIPRETEGSVIKEAIKEAGSYEIARFRYITWARGRTSFVELATEDSVESVIAKFAGLQIGGETVTVSAAIVPGLVGVRAKQRFVNTRRRRSERTKAEGAATEGAEGTEERRPAGENRRGKSGEAAKAPAAEGEAKTARAPRKRKNERRPRRQEPIVMVDNGVPTLIVRNIPFAASSDDLLAFFKAYNPTSASVAARDGKSLGYGFVEFSDAEKLDTALETLNNTDFQGRTIMISKPAPPKEETAEAEAQA